MVELKETIVPWMAPKEEGPCKCLNIGVLMSERGFSGKAEVGW